MEENVYFCSNERLPQLAAPQEILSDPVHTQFPGIVKLTWFRVFIALTWPYPVHRQARPPSSQDPCLTVTSTSSARTICFLGVPCSKFPLGQPSTELRAERNVSSMPSNLWVSREPVWAVTGGTTHWKAARRVTDRSASPRQCDPGIGRQPTRKTETTVGEMESQQHQVSEAGTKQPTRPALLREAPEVRD